MNDSKKPSRRDWFRLNVPVKNQSEIGEDRGNRQSTLDSDSSDPSKSILKAVELPPNYGGVELAELPPMREAVLSADQIRNLISDISELAADVVLMHRAEGAQKTDGVSKVDSTKQLELSRDLLISGKVARLQIRYRWRNADWIDTLKRVPEGFHIVRIAHGKTSS